MTETKNNMEQVCMGYNICPYCGRAPYETMDGYDTYRVGCAFCGLTRGVMTFLDNPINEEVKEATRKEWNRKCLHSSYTDTALERMGAKEGDFVITWQHDDTIECVVHDSDDIIKIIGDDELIYNIYRVSDNCLELLGSSVLVMAILKKH